MINAASIDSTGVRGLPAVDKLDIIIGSQKRNGSVLVASGDKYIREQLAAILERMGYDVVVSGNGEEALNQFLNVFTELKMPGMDGLTLSLQIKASSLNTPVVLILNEYMENFMNRIKAGRIDCVIFKPLGFREIRKVVQYYLRTRRYEKHPWQFSTNPRLKCKPSHSHACGIISHQPDLIHCCDWMTGLIPAAARFYKIPCLFTVQKFDTAVSFL
ncbi:MAG: response regulator, partial [Desulfobacterales bacterium]